MTNLQDWKSRMLDVEKIQGRVEKHITERDTLVKDLMVLKESESDPNATSDFLRLLPSRVASVAKRLEETKEQISFDLAFIDSEIKLIKEEMDLL